MDRVHLSIAIDHLRVAENWSRFMVEHGKQLDVLVKIDVGYHRCGIDPDLQTAVKFLQHTASLQGLRLRGLLSHAGHSYNAKSDDERVAIAKDEAAILRNLANESRRVGVAIDEISVGSTATALISASETGLTELRPGNYVYYDRSQVAIGSATLKDCALSVLATVVSKPAEDRLVLDCGSKILTSDTGRGKVQPKGYGAVFTKLETTTPDDTLFIDRLSEEHAVVMAQNGSSRLEPGDRVRILPNHSCVVSNLVDTVYLVDDLTVVQSIPITARGKVT
jgi:D-serine deaminase-like pyridoxal phosphate-dependent protein